MTFLRLVTDNLMNHFENHEIYPTLIVAVLFMVSIMALYEFIVYKYVLHRSLYNKAFCICIALVPYFISTIILCLQSNLVITLGTIGALAIIRFRTAVKDPVDIVFLLWAIHIGIMCGCQLYQLGIATSVIATIVLIIINRVSIGRKSHILIIKLAQIEAQREVEQELKSSTIRYRIKSRNFTKKDVKLVVEMITKEPDVISEKLSKLEFVENFSLMEYDPNDII